MEQKKYPGNVLIKVLAVVTFIVLVALVLIPRLVGVGSPRNHSHGPDSHLSMHLQRLRSAIAQFQADTGVWPAQLTDIVAPAGSTPLGTKTKKYQGPYLTPNGGLENTGIPANPFVDQTRPIAAHWRYDSKTGVIHSAVAGTTLDGVPYTAL
jgi:hypothetical protein